MVTIMKQRHKGDSSGEIILTAFSYLIDYYNTTLKHSGSFFSSARSEKEIAVTHLIQLMAYQYNKKYKKTIDIASHPDVEKFFNKHLHIWFKPDDGLPEKTTKNLKKVLEEISQQVNAGAIRSMAIRRVCGILEIVLPKPLEVEAKAIEAASPPVRRKSSS